MWAQDRDRILRKIQTKVILRQKGIATDCSHCNFDPVTKESSDPNCSYCKGTGKVYTDDKITVINANIRELGGESALRRDLGNIVHSATLLYCAAKYKNKIKLAYKITVGDIDYSTYKDADGKLVMRQLRDPDGKIDRLEVTLEKLQ